MSQAFKLGRISKPVPDRAPNLRMHALAAMTAPPKLDRSHIDYRPQLDGNSQIGDCTAVGIANAIRAQAALAGYQVDIPEADTVAFYSASCGYVPGNPATDHGGTEVDVLDYQIKHGFTGNGQTPYAGLWASIEPDNLNTLRVAMTRLGVGYLGVLLAEADQASVGGVWDTDTSASAGDPKPGSWGGHCLLAYSYSGVQDNDLVQLVTWGTLQSATWRWVRSRIEEAHAIVHRQLLLPAGVNGCGLDWDTLAADCAAFSA